MSKRVAKSVREVYWKMGQENRSRNRFESSQILEMTEFCHIQNLVCRNPREFWGQNSVISINCVYKTQESIQNRLQFSSTHFAIHLSDTFGHSKSNRNRVKFGPPISPCTFQTLLAIQNRVKIESKSSQSRVNFSTPHFQCILLALLANQEPFKN